MVQQLSTQQNRLAQPRVALHSIVNMNYCRYTCMRLHLCVYVVGGCCKTEKLICRSSVGSGHVTL